MLTYQVQQVNLQRQRTAVIRSHVEVEEIPSFLTDAFGEVLRAMAAQRLSPSGPPFSRYTPTSDGFDVEAGFPSDAEVEAHGRVVSSELPAGPAVSVMHRGDYSAVPAAYMAATRWVDTHGYVPDGQPWESYLDGPDTSEPRTVVYLPYRNRIG